MADGAAMSACLLRCRTGPRDPGPLPAIPDTTVLHCNACNAARLHRLPVDEAIDECRAGAYAAGFGAADPFGPAFISDTARKPADRRRFPREHGSSAGMGVKPHPHQPPGTCGSKAKAASISRTS